MLTAMRLGCVHPTVSGESVIEFQGLTKYYGDVKGVENLSFTVGEGEVFGFLGPNGAGKSTTIRLLLGLLSPTSGSGTILGNDITDRRELQDAMARVGHIPDDVEFYDEMTGERLLDYFAGFRGDSRREELLERFPIPKNRAVKEYSSGNRQKLAIVQAFMHDPDLLIMDEPTSGLDPLLQNEFYNLLAEEQRRGVTIFFSSHILSEVRRTCDRVAIIRDGQLVTLEEIQTLLEKSGKVVTVTFSDAPSPDVFNFDGVSQTTVDDGVYTLIITGNYDALIERLGDYSIQDISIRETALDDVFMHFYDDSPSNGELSAAGDATPSEGDRA